MKNIYLGIISLFTITPCIAQENMHVTKRGLLKDFDIFRNIFEQANAGLYKYHNQQQIDSAFLVNRKRITNKTTYRDFYNLVWNVIDFTGSCHNRLSYPDSVDKALSRQKIFFPIPLKYLNGKLYSTIDNKKIPLGSELVSVNKIDAGIFAKAISKYSSTDGHNTTGKYAFLETDWLPFYIYLAFGNQNNFIIEYKKGININYDTLPAVDYKTAIANYKSRFIPAYEKENNKDYFFRYLAKQTGLLTINTFALGGPKSDGHKKYAAFLDSVFTDLSSKSVQHLVVDIRQNGGGNDPNDLLLYSYLTRRNFRENRGAFTLFNTVPLKRYFVEEDDDEIKDLEKELKEEHAVFKEGKYYQHDSFNKIWAPQKNAFQGKIYLLISPFVASAGSLFASMVKSDDHTVVIGQESLGGYYGHTGHTPVTYRLPNTGLQLTFSIVDVEQDVQQLVDEKYGDGVKPDITVEPSIEEYLAGVDRVLQFVKQLTEK